MNVAGDFDYFALDDASTRDPFEFYELARQQGPVYQDPHTGVYVLTSLKHIIEVSRNTEEFSSAVCATGPETQFPEPLTGTGEGLQQQLDRLVDSIPGAIPFLSYDPPRHTRLRRMLARLFTPAHVARIEPRAVQLANQLIDGFGSDGAAEWTTQFSEPFSFLVISELFGIPEDGKEELRVVLADADRGTAVGQPGRSTIEVMMGHVGEILGRYIPERRDEPRDDVLSEIACARYEDTGELPELTDWIPVLGQVFSAGAPTTSALIAHAMRIAATDPSMQIALHDEPGYAERLVEETLRFEAPVKGLFRLAKVDVQVGETPVPAGSVVMLCYQAANRDPSEFECPARIDVRREGLRRHVAFGHGPHLCLGAPVARLEARVALEVTFDRLYNVRLSATHGRAERLPSFVVNGLTQLYLDFDERP